jgi:outer membrane protein insertion porin family
VAGLATGLSLPASAQSFEFSSVQVSGNVFFEEATVRRYAAVPLGQPLSAAELNAAYQRLVNSGIFELVTLTPLGDRLDIEVVEYPVINVIAFEGNTQIKDENLAAMIGSASSDVYSPAKAEADAQTLILAYLEAGRVAASVEPRVIRRSGSRVDLVFEIAEGKVVEIERLGFVGNRSFSDRRLRQILKTKQAGLLRQLVMRDTLIPERINLDKRLLKDFYLSRGYIDFNILNASADLTRERDGYFVTFTVREGLHYKFKKAKIVSEIPGVNADDFVKLISVKEGQSYTPSAIDLTIRRIESLIIKRGSDFISVDPRIKRNLADQTINVDFVLVKAQRIFVERIDIHGNVATLDRVIRNQFRSAEGDPFNKRELQQTAERLRALGFFADVAISSQTGSSSDQKIIDLAVVEKPTGSLSFGFAYSVSTGVGLNLSLSEANFLGRGQSLTLKLTTGTSNEDIYVSFSEPTFLNRDLTFNLSAGKSSTTGSSASYNTSNQMFLPQLSFPMGEMGRFSVNANYDKSEISKVDTTNPILLLDQGKQTIFSLGYGLSYDTRKSGLNPTGGVLIKFDQDFSGLTGDIKSMRTRFLGMVEGSVMKEAVSYRMISEGGVYKRTNGNSRLTERFFARGKIRGFDRNGIGPRDYHENVVSQDALGGNYFASLKMEADFPIGMPEEYQITGGVFYDMGSVWGLDNTTGYADFTVDDGFHLRQVAGLSVFWTTPVGPLRFNWTKALQSQGYDKVQNFDLTLSTKF